MGRGKKYRPEQVVNLLRQNPRFRACLWRCLPVRHCHFDSWSKPTSVGVRAKSRNYATRCDAVLADRCPISIRSELPVKLTRVQCLPEFPLDS